MTDAFGATYAQQYDLLYQNKNYDAEVALLERLFAKHDLKGNAVLELALLFEASGLELLELRAFGDADVPPTEETWSVLAVGRAVG